MPRAGCQGPAESACLAEPETKLHAIRATIAAPTFFVNDVRICDLTTFIENWCFKRLSKLVSQSAEIAINGESHLAVNGGSWESIGRGMQTAICIKLK